MASKKNHIFSSRQKVRTIKELLNVADLNELNWSERKKLARHVNREAKKMQRDAPNHYKQPESWQDFLTDENNPDPVDAFDKLLKQKEFLDWQAIEEHIRENKEKHGELNEVLEDKDKWTILRRLAVYDARLNIDRAYASETLREIEDMIEQSKDNPYIDMDYITNDMLATYMEIGSVNKHWNESLHPFNSQSERDNSIHSANSGFHGTKKAYERYEREKRRDLSGYEPSWQSPFWFDKD